MPNTAAHPDNSHRGFPLRAPAGATAPTTQPAGNPSPECARILAERRPLESLVDGLRNLVRFHEASTASNAAEDADWHRGQLKKALADIISFDISTLNDECRARLARFGMPFAYPFRSTVMSHLFSTGRMTLADMDSWLALSLQQQPLAAE